jgi:hypothetical protein
MELVANPAKVRAYVSFWQLESYTLAFLFSSALQSSVRIERNLQSFSKLFNTMRLH